MLPGIETKEPAFGVQARWIQPGLEEQALGASYCAAFGAVSRFVPIHRRATDASQPNDASPH